MPKSKKAEKRVSVSANTNSLFKPHKNKPSHCTQNVNVTVNIDQKEDAVTGCFKALANIFKRK